MVKDKNVVTDFENETYDTLVQKKLFHKLIFFVNHQKKVRQILTKENLFVRDGLQNHNLLISAAYLDFCERKHQTYLKFHVHIKQHFYKQKLMNLYIPIHLHKI